MSDGRLDMEKHSAGCATAPSAFTYTERLPFHLLKT